MAYRQIRTFDDEILRRKCKRVEEVDDRIRSLLGDMMDTLRHTPNGGALAACQIGVLKRLVVIDLGDGVFKLVNPEILSADGEQYGPEACLSFPGMWGEVRRPRHVVVRATNENGEEITVEGEDLMARCLCHEIDHLDGIVFCDKADKMHRSE